MRAFLAVELPEPIRAALASLQRRLAESRADVAWVQPPNLHLTMRFLGEITEAQRQQIEAATRRIAAGMSPFQVSLAHLGAFPSLRAPRVLWVSIEQGKDRLMALAKGLEQESVNAGLQPEERAFVAHVTIGRVRSATRRVELSRALSTAPRPRSGPPACAAQALTLFQSTLQRDGAVYTVLAKLPFTASPPPAAS